jgi:hypothetical protein
MIDTFAYTPLRGIIADLLGHGVPIDPMIPSSNTIDHYDKQSIQAYNECDVVTKIMNDHEVPTLVLRGTRWSDAFESTTSMNRIGRSVDLLSTTIGAPSQMKHSSDTTYISAIGRKTDSLEMEQMYSSDILSFNEGGGTWIYWHELRCEVLCTFYLTLVIADNPELHEVAYWCISR